MSISIVFSLRHKPSGSLAGVRTIGPFEEYSPREHHLVLLSDCAHAQPYEVDTAEKAALVLAIDTPMYSSSHAAPGWGGLNMEEFEVVKIERATTVSSVQVELPVKFDHPVESRNTAPMVASRYLKRQVECVDGLLRLHFVKIPVGESFDSLRKKCDDKDILLGPLATILTKCVGVFETPEEYVDLFNGKPSVGLVCYGFK